MSKIFRFRMLGLKVSALTKIKVPEELQMDILMEKKLDDIDPDNLDALAQDLTGAFQTDEELIRLAGYLDLWSAIRPLNQPFYADLAAIINTKVNKIFNFALLEKTRYSFLRLLFNAGVFTLEQIRRKCATEPNQFFFFVPELGITNAAIEFNDILEDPDILEHLQKDNWAMYRDLVEYGYFTSTLEYAIKFDNVDLLLEVWKGDDYYTSMEVDENCWEKGPWPPHNPLSMAARFGSINCFRNLIGRGSRPDENICENAIIGGNKEIIETVAQLGGDFVEGLKAATQYHRFDVFDWLLASYMPEMVDICYPAAYANWLVFLFCAANGSDIRSVLDETYESAVHWAAYWGIPYVMEICLSDKRCNINFVDGNKLTPLTWAAVEGNLTVGQILCEEGADPVGHNKESSPLLEAVRNNHLEFAKFLLDHGAQIDYVDDERNSVLHNAAFWGTAKLAQFLIENGASVDATNKYGDTPLHFAANNGANDIVKLFIKKGAEIDAVGTKSNTPLFNAVKLGWLDVVRTLVSNGANVNMKNYKDNTPLHYAAANGSFEIIDYLISKGASPRAINYDGKTPVDYALDDNTVSTLLSQGGIESRRVMKRISPKFYWKILGGLFSIMIFLLSLFVRF